MQNHPLRHPEAATSGAAAPVVSDADVKAINELRSHYQEMRTEVARIIIGQDVVIEKMLICILSRGLRNFPSSTIRGD